MDFVIWLQHVMVHAVPALWRLHRVHHADLDYDLTTGARFHPIEIILSMLIKFATIVVLGPPVVAVVIFEVLLNATAMFNHGNIRLPAGLDRALRWFVVTPDMHRVHHSVEDDETNSNFGFNLPWWDRLFGTYRDQPRAGHEGMTIGIRGHDNPRRGGPPGRHAAAAVQGRDHGLRHQPAQLFHRGQTMNKTVLRWLLGLTLLAAVVAAVALRDRFDTAALETWVSSAGAAGPLLFMALYALATVLFLPGSVITLAGGALFGPVWGTLWNLTGATIGASLAFLIARYLGADWVARRAGPRLQSLNEGVSAEGWRFVAFVRLVPLFPFNLLNYALGLTRIPVPRLRPGHLDIHAARRLRLHLAGLRRTRSPGRRRGHDPQHPHRPGSAGRRGLHPPPGQTPARQASPPPWTSPA
jgi:uncharacterized membrane protein YdjX (TVP38/TMEM64 family)